MPWSTRKKRKVLTPAMKREVRRIVQSTEPKQWEALFEVDPCECLAEEPGDDCSAVATLELFKSPGTSPQWGEAVCHRTRGGLWFVPEFGAGESACADIAHATDDIRMRLALVKRQVSASGSVETFNPWGPDWYQGDGVIWRHEHLFFSQWNESFYPATQELTTNNTVEGIIAMTAGNATPFAVPPCTEAPPNVWNAFFKSCGPGLVERDAYCVRTQDQARPYYWSASHIPKNLRVKDGEELLLYCGWAYSCAAAPLPALVITGGVYGEVSESTP